MKSGRIVSLGIRSLGERGLIRHEGFPGWKYQDFLYQRTTEPNANFREETFSPFLIHTTDGERCDFRHYIATHLDDREPDFITLALDTNDIAYLMKQRVRTPSPALCESALDTSIPVSPSYQPMFRSMPAQGIPAGKNY